MRGVDFSIDAANLSSVTFASGGADPNSLGRGYKMNMRSFIEQYVGLCPLTETPEATKSKTKGETQIPTSRTLTASNSISRSTNATLSLPLALGSYTSSTTVDAPDTQTESLSLSESFVSNVATVSGTFSATEECDESTIMESGRVWREKVISHKLNKDSPEWQHVLERDIIDGLALRFQADLPMPPNTSQRSESFNDWKTLRSRAIMYKSAATPKDRPVNFHGIRGASSPSYPYAIATVTDGFDVLLEMRPLPKFEIYADEWWEIYLPAAFVVPGACAKSLIENKAYQDMWGSISPGDDVRIVADDGLTAKENVYVYFTTISIEPSEKKILADVANGFAAGANGFAIAVGALSSTVISSASADIQAVGIFAHMEACNSPQISGFFGSPWVLSPVYLSGVFGDDEMSKMLGIISGNFLLIAAITLIQTIITICVMVFCPPDKSSGMTVFGRARFPSVSLSVAFGVHGGSVFAASRIIRLTDFDNSTEVAQYFVPAFLVVVYYILLPISLYFSAWWCIPRTFQIYDLEHRSIANAVKHRWLTKLLPVGAIYPIGTRLSAGIFISSFRRSSHIWVTSPVWVSTVSGIVGFAKLDEVEDNYGACFVWGIILGVVFLLMAAVYAWRMPKRHMMLTILDVISLVALAVLFGFTIPWRQIVYPPQERFSDGEAGKINWPDLAVVILSYIIIGLVALRAIASLLICAVELKVQSIDPPTYITWSHKSGGQMRSDRLAAINRLETDRAVLDEMFLHASTQDAMPPVLPAFSLQDEKGETLNPDGRGAKPTQSATKRSERVEVSPNFRGIHELPMTSAANFDPDEDFFRAIPAEMEEMEELHREPTAGPPKTPSRKPKREGQGKPSDDTHKRNTDASSLGVIFDQDTFAVIDDTFVDNILSAEPGISPYWEI